MLYQNENQVLVYRISQTVCGRGATAGGLWVYMDIVWSHLYCHNECAFENGPSYIWQPSVVV